MGLRTNIDIQRVYAPDVESCPGDRIKPIVSMYSDWEGQFQILEHWDGNNKPDYDPNIPLVIFHSEGDEKWIDINYYSQYGKVLHCNVKTGKEKGKFFNYWLYDYRNRILDYKIQLNQQNTFAPKFLSFNGRPDWHRYYLIQKYYDLDMFKDGYISLLNRYGNFDKGTGIEEFRSVYPGNTDYMDDIIKNKKLLIIDRTSEQIHKDDRSHDPWVYEETSLSVVSETYNDAVRGLFFTEKSYKPIANCHFQIWIAQPGIVEYFRDGLGFDMFDDIIDHSYDKILDDVSRVEAAISSIQKYINTIKTLSETKKIELQDRLQLNQKKFLNYRLTKEEINSWIN